MPFRIYAIPMGKSSGQITRCGRGRMSACRHLAASDHISGCALLRRERAELKSHLPEGFVRWHEVANDGLWRLSAGGGCRLHGFRTG